LRETSFINSKDVELSSLCSIHSSSSSTSSSNLPALPLILTTSLSSHLLSTTPNSNSLAYRLSHQSDSSILLSNFSVSKILRTSFPSYTGGVKIVKTPRLGTLLDGSIKASVLRGMGNSLASSASGSRGGATAGAGTGEEGGSGGTENNLAFKLKRKKLVVETLHLDIEDEVKERKPKGGKGNLDPPSKKQEIVQELEPRSSISTNGNSSSISNDSNSTNPSSSISQQVVTPVSNAIPTKPKSFGGLKALRQRGLAAKNQSLEGNGEVSVGVDEGTSSNGHGHGHDQSKSKPQSKNGIKVPVFKSDKMNVYEF